MSDDWLQHGHEMDGIELVPVLSSGALDARADAASTPRWTSGWRGLVVGGSIAVLATLGVVGVANAIGDNLFPPMGSARPSSVWVNPVPPTAPEQTVDVAPTITTATPTTTPSTSAPSPTAATTTPSTSSSTSRVTVPSTGVTSPTTSAPDLDDDEVVVVTTAPDQPDDSGSGSGSGSGDSGSGSSGSGSSGSDDLDDGDDD